MNRAKGTGPQAVFSGIEAPVCRTSNHREWSRIFKPTPHVAVFEAEDNLDVQGNCNSYVRKARIVAQKRRGAEGID